MHQDRAYMHPQVTQRPDISRQTAPSQGRVGESEKKRTICRGSKLTAGGKSVGHEALEKDGVEVGTGQVNGCCVSCGPRADDHLHRRTSELIVNSF